MKSNLKAEQERIAAPSGDSTIGMDLGDRWSRYCIVDAAGTIAKEDRVRTTPEVLEECFGKIPSTRIVIETGMHSPWVTCRYSERSLILRSTTTCGDGNLLNLRFPASKPSTTRICGVALRRFRTTGLNMMERDCFS